jgi:hypothetical protein
MMGIPSSSNAPVDHYSAEYKKGLSESVQASWEMCNEEEVLGKASAALNLPNFYH